MLDVKNAVLCSQLCRSVTVTRRPSGHVMLDTPFCYPDGDRYPIYVTETQTGGFRLSDGGHTLMHFSYEHDIDKLLKGARRVLMDQAITQEGANYDESSGTFYVETSPDHLADGVFRLGQALTRVFSLSSLIQRRR